MDDGSHPCGELRWLSFDGSGLQVTGIPTGQLLEILGAYTIIERGKSGCVLAQTYQSTPMSIQKSSKNRLLILCVVSAIACLILFSSFLVGTGSARPATIEGANAVPLLLAFLSGALAIRYFLQWRRLSPHE
jgi:hypothetical protein